MSDVLSVFLSSTFVDLQHYRAAVIQALLDAGFHPVGMENFMARTEEASVACMEEVVQSDLFVGIYAWRYGYIPPGSKVSITEQELLKAEETGKPCFCFFVDEKHPWPEEYQEKGSAAELLRELKKRIGGGRVVVWFTNPEMLAGKVIASLHRHVTRRAAVVPPALPTAELPAERRELFKLLNRVEGAWLRDVLERSAPKSRRIELKLEECPDAAVSPSADWQEAPAEPSFLSAEEIAGFFRERERSLLVLGNVGSGKTITLLLLARGLAAWARGSLDEPIPVVLNLSSWAAQRRPLAEWMVQEIRDRYQTGDEAPREWLKQHLILPLLDGLDEMEEGRRADCVEEINAWLDNHGLHGLAVCCRADIYRRLPRRLKLLAAVALRPLSASQVDEYVAAAPAGEALRTVLAADADLMELSQTPQNLSLMERICRDGGTLPVAAGPIEKTRRRLYQAYVELRLKRSASRHHSRDRALRTLSWLARRMKEHSLSLFGLEQLQPSWLSGPACRTYYLVTRMLAGVLLAWPVALWRGSLPVLEFGLAAGALTGIFDAMPWRGKLRPRVRLLAVATAVFLMFLAAGAAYNSQPVNVFLGASLFAAVFGSTLGVRSGQRSGSRDDIRVSEALPWSGWSWSRAVALKSGLAAALAALVPLVVNGIRRERSLGWEPFVVALAFVSLGSLAGGLLGGLKRGIVEKKMRPNQGIRLTLKNAGRVAFLFALLASLVAAVPAILFHWWVPVLWGPLLGYWVGLGYSGLDVLQHWVLRGLLWLWGCAPARYGRFLSYASDAALLKRSGGSYLFFYEQPMLEHMASRPEGAAGTPGGTVSGSGGTVPPEMRTASPSGGTVPLEARTVSPGPRTVPM